MSDKVRDIENILPLVQKPSRYINNEWNNSYSSKKAGGVKVCFCFPDLYELGASNLGVEILYTIVNSLEYASAERCYCPDTDMEEMLRKENIPLFSIETQRPLNDFDLLGFSLQYELCFTNILTMLDLSGIPVKSKDRNENHPVVIAGGPVCFNPEPVVSFFDAFVVGEGEDVIVEIVNTINTLKNEGKNKKELLTELSKIDGIYVPLKKAVCKRTVDIRKSFFPHRQIVPNLITVHSRFNVEISRGCPHGCRFCQAAGLYSPWREKPPGEVLSIIEKGIPLTGYDQLSLLSLSVTDYSEIDPVVKSLHSYCVKNNVCISLPSLRCNKKSIGLLSNLTKPRRSNLTLAIETASEDLRSIINKHINNQDVYQFVKEAYNLGWDLIKLYFMIGLPGEKTEDIENIITLVNSLKRTLPGMKFNVTVSPFVPKPHTPFQWCAMEDEKILEERKEYLFRKLKAKVKTHSVKMSTLEGVFTRGGNELSDVIVAAWEKGARFDHWHDRFNYKVWDEAFKESGIEKKSYLLERKENETLHWDYVNSGCSKEVYLNGYNKAMELIESRKTSVLTPVSGGVFVSPRHKPRPSSFRTVPFYEERGKPIAHSTFSVEKMPFFKYRLRFSRKGKMRFLSQLEQIELIRRCIRRASLPVAHSYGFHPQMKISFGPAISVGYESDCEYADAVFTGAIDMKSTAVSINNSLPEGFSLIEIKQIPIFFKPVEVETISITYSVENLTDITGNSVEELKRILGDTLSSAQMLIEKKPNVVLDAKPLLNNPYFDGSVFKFELKLSPGRNIKPEKILAKIFDLNDKDVSLLIIKRLSLTS